nr:hypothetical protein [Tanacetum cinerariifolium]GEV94560.1 hypothetical protein [Tanacetum cinerariifolium]
MSTQQDIYAASSENRPPMLNKENYVPWSSSIIRYARSRPNGKIIVDSLRMVQNDIKRMDVDDQAIQTILLGLPEDVYAAVDSYETAKEIWERVRQMMKGSDIGEQEKKEKLFNEWEKFTSTDGESIESHYHHFMQLMNDLKRNKHFPKQMWIDKFKMLEKIVGISLDSVQNGGNQNGLVVVPRIANQNGTCNIIAARDEGTGNRNQASCYNCRGLGHIARNCTARPRRRDVAYLQTQLLIAKKEEAGIQLQAEEFNCMAAADGSDKVQLNENCYNYEIFNMFTQEEQYMDLLEPIPEPQLVPHNDNHVTSVAPSMVQSGGTVETSSAPNEETRAHQETVYHNLIDQVAQVNTVNCNMRATNAELKSELARYKIQEQRIEISQEKYDKLEKCYQKSVYQEQCLTRKINALHLSSAKQIMTLNDEISNLNKQL